MNNLLAKTRLINKILQDEKSLVNFAVISEILSENIFSNCYIIDNKGQILSCKKNVDETFTENIIENGFVSDCYNKCLLQTNETKANVDFERFFGIGLKKLKKNVNLAIVPIIGGGERFGTLLLEKSNSAFMDEDLILAEYAAAVIAMEFLRTKIAQKEEEARQKATVQVAISTLSYSELDAVKHIFKQLDGKEGVLVASKIADNIGITRSVIVNALRKFESAGVIESKSLGMKGTYIKILNNYLLKMLEKY
ncbi:GTP-sensing pleiotropic transcriptional regulator CodY [Peptococcaceae bacterium]|nr:GTP-sensing pleiotropic transcriptional regulator CodY [Peptococcaceae bacterium]